MQTYKALQAIKKLMKTNEDFLELVDDISCYDNTPKTVCWLRDEDQCELILQAENEGYIKVIDETLNYYDFNFDIIVTICTEEERAEIYKKYKSGFSTRKHPDDFLVYVDISGDPC